MAAVFTAADTTTLLASCSALVVGFVGIGLVFLARKYLRKSGVPV